LYPCPKGRPHGRRPFKKEIRELCVSKKKKDIGGRETDFQILEKVAKGKDVFSKEKAHTELLPQNVKETANPIGGRGEKRHPSQKKKKKGKTQVLSNFRKGGIQNPMKKNCTEFGSGGVTDMRKESRIIEGVKPKTVKKEGGRAITFFKKKSRPKVVGREDPAITYEKKGGWER